MPRPMPNRRKKMLVNRPLQGRLIFSMTFVPLVMLLGVAGATTVYALSLVGPVDTGVEIADIAPPLAVMLGFQLLAAYFMLLHALRASHRVAGPAYRICKSIERIRQGDLAFRVQLRKGDHLGEIQQELNKLIDWLSHDSQRLATAGSPPMAAELGAAGALAAERVGSLAGATGTAGTGS